MVSFSCHACGDVVKKPKLDQHRTKCRSGFDCLDCQTTFNTPNEYKGHTSCITEAQKYQKGLFKGPKKPPYGQNGDHTPRREGGFRSNRSFGHHGRSDVAGRRDWGQPRYEGTGANDTPLGTPKMTPVTRSPDPPSPAASAEAATMPHAALSPASENKRKSSGVETNIENRPQEPPNKKVKLNGESASMSIERTEANTGTSSNQDTTKKPKEGRENRSKPERPEVVARGETSASTIEDKESKRQKKKKRHPTNREPVELPAERKSGELERQQNLVSLPIKVVHEGERKERKKKQKAVLAGNGEGEGNGPEENGADDENLIKERKKKKQKSIPDAAEAIESDERETRERRNKKSDSGMNGDIETDRERIKEKKKRRSIPIVDGVVENEDEEPRKREGKPKSTHGTDGVVEVDKHQKKKKKKQRINDDVDGGKGGAKERDGERTKKKKRNACDTNGIADLI